MNKLTEKIFNFIFPVMIIVTFLFICALFIFEFKKQMTIAHKCDCPPQICYDFIRGKRNGEIIMRPRNCWDENGITIENKNERKNHD